MPPKSVTCSICSAEVLKAQTLARADGTRACRSHEGVADEAEKRLAAERAEREKHDLETVNARVREQWRTHEQAEHAAFSANWEKEAAEWREKIYSHCWTCGEYGLEGREFFAQALIAMKRLEMRREFNFLSVGPDVRKFMGNVQLLSPIKLGTEVVDRAVVKHVTERKLREIVPLMGFVLLCPPCCDKHGFKKRLEDMMPKPTWEQLEAMMPVVAGLDPLLREMAEKKEGQS
jgi:hypothetical protein